MKHTASAAESSLRWLHKAARDWQDASDRATAAFARGERPSTADQAANARAKDVAWIALGNAALEYAKATGAFQDR